MARRWYRFKLLLDENFPTRDKLPRLNHRFNLKHLVVDLRRSGITDRQVYELACNQGRLVITFNDKDFRELAATNKTGGIIGVSANLTIESIDKKLTALLIKSRQNQLFGHFTYVSGERTDW